MPAEFIGVRRIVTEAKQPFAPRAALIRLLWFFVVAFSLAWIPWLAVILLKGTPTQLAFIGLYAPALAAFAIAALKGGRAEVGIIVARFSPIRMAARWWLLAILLMPATFGIAAIAAGGWQSIHLLLNASSWWFLPTSFVYLLIITAGEEIGWRGYALPLMLEARIPPLLAAIALGLIWGAWHIPLRIPSGLSSFPLPLFLLFTTALSVVYLIVFQQSGGSLLPALLLHASTDFAPRIIDVSRLSSQFWLVVDIALVFVSIVLCGLEYAAKKSAERNNVPNPQLNPRRSDREPHQVITRVIPTKKQRQ